MIIHSPRVVEFHDEARFQCDVAHSGGVSTLWYSFHPRFLDMVPTHRLDPFLVGLLPLAMQEGEEIVLEGPVSEKLLFNLRWAFMPLAAINNPELRPIRISPSEVESGLPGPSGKGVAAGFSAGVDSLCAVYDHFVNSTLPSFKLTHLFFNNVGSHGEFDSERARELFLARYEKIKDLPMDLGLELISLDSNLSDLLKMNFQRTHISRNVSCALLFQSFIGKYYYAASIRYHDARMKGARDMCGIEAAALHLLSTENVECVLTGANDTRVEKTRRAVLVPGAGNFFNVCVAPLSDGGNCSACKKCKRTLITLELLGEDLERYQEVFDLKRWHRLRTHYIMDTVLRKPGNILLREIRDHARNTNFHFPWWQRLGGFLLTLVPRKRDRWVRDLRSGARRRLRVLLGRNRNA